MGTRNQPRYTPENELDETWKQRSKCFGVDPDVFFDIDAKRLGSPRTRQRLLTVQETYCFQCPVWSECFDYAVATEARGGIWGGMVFGYQAYRDHSAQWFRERKDEIGRQIVKYRLAKIRDKRSA